MYLDNAALNVLHVSWGDNCSVIVALIEAFHVAFRVAFLTAIW